MHIKTLGLLIIVLVLTVLAVALHAAFSKNSAFPISAQQASITNFETCAAAGNPIMESYPRQCRSADGRVFVENTPATPTNEQGATGSGQIVGSGCVVGGCSNELCTDAGSGNTISNCIYNASYACYKTATCERQASGHCGWTQSPQLQQCTADSAGSAQPIAPDSMPTNVNTY